MILSQHFLFFFAMLGAFTGMALSAVVWWHANGKPANRWLSLLIFVVSVRTGKSVVYYFLPDLPRGVLQIGLTACVLIGPCLYFLARSCRQSAAHPNRADRLHIAAIVVIVVAVNVFFPYTSDNIQLWRRYVIPGIEYVWLGYLVLTSVHLYVHRAQLGDTPSGRMLLGVAAGVWSIWIAYFTSGYTSYIFGALTFTFVLALSAVVYVQMRKGDTAIEPYEDRRIPALEAATQLNTLAELMARERLHVDPSLTLPRLARRLGQPQARLSQLLNDNNKTSFKQYLTQLRVDEAKLLLQQSPQKPLEIIAESAGFQSMSTFYSAFKKSVGVTPAAYRSVHESKNSGSENRFPDS
jgi:AraC-like DNA-binding protein